MKSACSNKIMHCIYYSFIIFHVFYHAMHGEIKIKQVIKDYDDVKIISKSEKDEI